MAELTLAGVLESRYLVEEDGILDSRDWSSATSSVKLCVHPQGEASGPASLSFGVFITPVTFCSSDHTYTCVTAFYCGRRGTDLGGCGLTRHWTSPPGSSLLDVHVTRHHAHSIPAATPTQQVYPSWPLHPETSAGVARGTHSGGQGRADTGWAPWCLSVAGGQTWEDLTWIHYYLWEPCGQLEKTFLVFCLTSVTQWSSLGRCPQE